MKSSLEIAQEAELIPIDQIGATLGLEPDELEPYGRFKGKIELSVLERLKDRPDGKLICVAGMTPTKAGEGKTTTAVSLTQGMGKIGKTPVLCLREPSLGPVFGIKGGAAGGGYARVAPNDCVVADNAAWWVEERAHDRVLGVIGHLHRRNHPLDFVGVDD